MMMVTKDIGLAYHFLNQHQGERFTAEQVAAGAGIKLAAAQRVGMLLAELRIFNVRLNPQPRRYELVVPPIEENIPRVHAIEDELRTVILPDLRRATAQAKAKEDLASGADDYPPHDPKPDRRSTPRHPHGAGRAPNNTQPGPPPNGGGSTQPPGSTASAPGPSPAKDNSAPRGTDNGVRNDEATVEGHEEPASTARAGQNDLDDNVHHDSTRARADVPTFVFSPGSASARARETDRGFAVLAGSTAKLVTTATFPSGSLDLRSRLLSDGILLQKADGDVLTFATDYVFASSSAAASIVAGRSASGPLEWKHSITGQNYRNWAAAKTN